MAHLQAFGQEFWPATLELCGYTIEITEFEPQPLPQNIGEAVTFFDPRLSKAKLYFTGKNIQKWVQFEADK